MTPLRVLLVEDSQGDAELILRTLRRAGFEPEWQQVQTEADFLANLHAGLDLVLSDYQMPGFDGMRALELLKTAGFSIPFILISGTIGEDLAVAAMRQGATDYLIKDRLGRLGPAVSQALEQSRLQKERLALQHEVAVRQQRLDAFFTRAPAGLALLDRELRFVQINSTLAEMNGQPAEAQLGKTLAEILPDLAPMLEPILRKVLETGESVQDVEVSGKTPGQAGVNRSWMQSFFPVPGKNGLPDGVGSIAVETTARRRAEARVRDQAAMLDQAHDAIIVRELESRRITYWNRGAERLYGWTAEEAIGREISELIFVDHSIPDLIATKLRETREWHGEHRHRTKDGRELIVRGHATLVRDGDGQPGSVLVINYDVTEQKNLEAQMLRAQRLESIGTLASGVAHDLNNILSPIMMSAPLLRQDLPAVQRDSIVATIEKSAARGAQIVRQVLTFGRGLEGERKPMQLGELLEELGHLVRETFPKDVTVEMVNDAELWPVIANATQLHQVLLNLSVNARDAMSAGGALRISASNLLVDESYVSMLPQAKEGPYVQVEVSDTGCGIPPAILERIFDPFFTTKGVGKGTGLGLSTVFGIVHAHGGFLSVSSVVGKGSRFQVFLPAISSPAIGLEKTPAMTLSPSGRGETVLVVDDEETVLRAAESVLRESGYEVLVAGDGVQALAVFAMNADRISVVLTDVMMPKMDGVVLTRALLKMQRGLPIIAATGLGEEGQRSELQSLGVTTILDKPFGADTMLEAVHSALRK